MFTGNKLLHKWLKSDKLSARFFRGGAVLTAGTALERAIRFLRGIILARLLAPDQFGLMALVLASNGLFEVLTEMGIRWAVIQNKKGDSPEFLNAVFWVGVIRGIGLYGIGFFAAPFVASFYQEPALKSLLQVSFLAILLNGITCPGLYALEKKLKFMSQVIVVQGAGLIGTVVSLLVAFHYPSVWSLVIGFVSEAAFRFIGSYVVYPFRPSWKTDSEAKRDLFQFSRGIVGIPLLTYLFIQADIFVLGKFCSKEILGLYAMAIALASIPLNIFSKTAGRLALPAFSEMQDQQDRLASNMLRMNRVIFLFVLPATVVSSIFARPILEIVYGVKYVPIASAFSFLCFYYLIYMSNMVIASAYLALGRPDLQRVFTVVRLMILVIGLFPLVNFYGAAGAAAMRVLCMLFAGMVQFYNFSTLLKISRSQYINSVKDGLWLAVVIAIPAIIIRYSINQPIVLLITAGFLWIMVGLIGIGIFKGGVNRFHLRPEKPSL